MSSLSSSDNRVKSGDILRIWNKSFNYYQISQEKTIDFFTKTQRKVTSIFSQQKSETNTNIVNLEEQGHSNLNIQQKPKKIGINNSILTLFEIIKLNLTESDIEHLDDSGNFNEMLKEKRSPK